MSTFAGQTAHRRPRPPPVYREDRVIARFLVRELSERPCGRRNMLSFSIFYSVCCRGCTDCDRPTHSEIGE
jgi:hypothetical protein